MMEMPNVIHHSYYVREAIIQFCERNNFIHKYKSYGPYGCFVAVIKNQCNVQLFSLLYRTREQKIISTLCGSFMLDIL